MTYPVYAQKARLPQRRPRFLFHRPARSIIRVTLPCPPAAVYGQGASRDAEAPRDTDAKTLRHRNSKTLRHQNHTPPRRPSLRSQPANASQLQPTGCSHPDYNRPAAPTPASTGSPQSGSALPPRPEQERPSLPRHKKTGSCPCWGSFPIIRLQVRAYFCTIPDAASRRLLRCLR